MASKLKTAERIARQGLQGLTFGFGDELVDALAGVGTAALTDMSLEDALRMSRNRSQQELSQDWEEAPWTSGIAQVVGGLPLGFTKPAISAANWIGRGGKLAGVGKGAVLGAGLGGISGVGSAGDDIGERVAGGAIGAGIGGVAGGVLSPLSRLGQSADNVDFRKVADKTTKKFTNKAEQELARQLSARPDLANQLTRAELMNTASRNTGIKLTLPEMLAQSSSDPLLAQQAVVGSNPMTAGRMAQMYAARSGTPQQAGQIEAQLMRLAQQLDPTVGSYDDAARAVIGQADEASRNITRQLSEQARPLYDAAYQASLKTDDAVLQNPLIQSALQKVRSNPVFAQEIGDAPDNSIRALDAVKRSLDDMAETANRQGNRNEARLIQNARTQLLQAMDEASPAYAQARQIYSGNPDALQMRERIGALANIDPMDARSVGRNLFKGTQQNADLASQALGERAPTAAAARIYGAMDELRNDPVNIANRIAPDKRTADMLRTYAGNNNLDETLNVINQAKLGERSRFGSPTQPRQAAERTLENAAGDALNTAVDVKTGGVTAIIRNIASKLGRGNQEQDPQFYADMADLMLTDRGMDLLRRVAQGQQTAIQELQSIGLPSLMIGNVNRATATMPVTNAAISGAVTPQYPESPLRINQDRFSEFDRLIQQNQNPRFQEFDRILQGVQ